MDYLTGMASSPVYEFPYSGAHMSSLPFLNHNSNSYGHSYPSHMSSPFDSFYHKQPSVYPTNNIPQMGPNWGSNAIVYQVPGHIPLDVILRELGVDVNSLHQSSFNNYYPSASSSSPPVDFIFAPPKRQRRRRVLCREVTDSESDDDDDYNRSSRDNRHRKSRSRQNDQPSTHLHSLLKNVWEKAANAPGDLSRSNSAPNSNSPWPPVQNPPTQYPSTQYPPMQNPPQPLPPPNPAAIGNLWNRAANATNPVNPSNPTNPKPSPLSDLLNKTRSTSGNIFQPPRGMQQNQEAVQDFNAARYAVGNVTQPGSAVSHTWNMAHNAPYGPPPPSNIPWNPMSGGPPRPQQQQQSSPMNSMWGQMAGAQPPPQSPPPMNPGWNPMSGRPPLPPQQQSSAVNSVWSRMAGAPPPPQSPPPMNPGWNPMSGGPPQQPFYPPGPPANQSWNQMQQGPPSPPNPSYPYPPMGPQQQGPPPPSGAGNPFTSMFSRT